VELEIHSINSVGYVKQLKVSFRGFVLTYSAAGFQCRFPILLAAMFKHNEIVVNELL